MPSEQRLYNHLLKYDNELSSSVQLHWFPPCDKMARANCKHENEWCMRALEQCAHCHCSYPINWYGYVVYSCLLNERYCPPLRIWLLWGSLLAGLSALAELLMKSGVGGAGYRRCWRISNAATNNLEHEAAILCLSIASPSSPLNWTVWACIVFN